VRISGHFSVIVPQGRTINAISKTEEWGKPDEAATKKRLLAQQTLWHRASISAGTRTRQDRS
jgi:hypothetical protein